MKRFILTLFIILLFAVPGWCAPALVQSYGTASTSQANVTTSVGDLIVVAVSNGDSDPTVSDGVNSYTEVDKTAITTLDGALARVKMWYAIASTNTSTLTISIGSSNNLQLLAIGIYSGINSVSPLDAASTGGYVEGSAAQAHETNATPGPTGTISATNATGGIMVGIWGEAASSIPGTDRDSWHREVYVIGYGGTLVDKPYAGAGSYTCSTNTTSLRQIGCVWAAFKGVNTAPVVSSTIAAVPVIASYNPMVGTTATATGTITNNGGATITEYGFVLKPWANSTTNPGNPTTSDTKVVIGTDDHSGAFGSAGDITGLTLPSTKYNIRAYATNSIGTTYSSITKTFPNHYYFAAAGNDTSGAVNDITSPYLTLAKFNTLSASMQAMDYVLFNRGDVWYGDATIAITPVADIQFGAYGSGDKPKLTTASATPVSSWGAPASGVYPKTEVAACYGLYQDGYLLGNAATDANCTDGNWYFDAPNTTLYYKPTTGVATDHTVNIDPKTVASTGIFGTSVSGWSMTNMQLQDVQILCAYSSNHSFTYLDLYDRSSHISFTTTAAQGSFANYLIDHCTFYYTTTCPIAFASGDVQVVVDGLTITNNTILYDNKTYYNGRWVADTNDNDSLYLQNITNLIVQYNEIGGGNCDGDAAIQHFCSNTINPSGVISNNYIHDVPCWGIFISGGQANHHDIYNNIITNCATVTNTQYGPRKGAAIWVTGPQPSGTPGLIANNTIYNSGDIGIALGSNADYYLVENNIVHTATNYYNYISGNPANSTINYNCYYNPGSGNVFRFNGGDQNWATWSGSRDGNGITSDPLFVNAGGSYALATDFKLQATSPCINTGTNTGITTDYEGAARPQ